MYVDNIEGWMSIEQLKWLFNTAKEMETIVEVGSYKGRSTYALLTGTDGTVWAVDPFTGMKIGDFYDDFVKNVGHFENLKILRMKSEEAVKQFKDKSIDMVFIDGDHTYEEVKKDIEMWLPKVKKLICGHDYQGADVRKAVDEKLKVEVSNLIWIYKI